MKKTTQTTQDQCGRCMQYVQEVLLSGETRSRALLNAMGASVIVAPEEDSTKISCDKKNEVAVVTVSIPFLSSSSSLASPIIAAANGDKNVSENTRRVRDRQSSNNNNNLASSDTRPLHLATSSTPPPPYLVSPHESDQSNAANENETSSISVTVSCAPCGTTGPEAGARAYVRGPEPLDVVLCQNRLHSLADVEEVLVHELVHVYDVKVRGLDLHNCHNLAYSEVRAAREAECGGSTSSLLFPFRTKLGQSFCTRSRALIATANLFPGEQGRKCVCDVFQEAMADMSPFGTSSSPRSDHGTTSSRGIESTVNSSGGGGDVTRDVATTDRIRPKVKVTSRTKTVSLSPKGYNYSIPPKNIINGRSFTSSYSSSEPTEVDVWFDEK